jgi:hypothetical protein
MVRRRFTPPPPWGDRPVARRLALEDDPSPSTWIGFVGDICPLGERAARYGDGVHDFFAGCDLIAGNFEGVFTDERWWPFRHRHAPSIFETLARLTPLDRWVLSVANNHAGDYGDAALRTTTARLAERGIRWLGTRRHPSLSLPESGLALTTWTRWLNGRSDLVARRDPGPPDTPGLRRVAFPHWGYEHERTPRSEQRRSVPAGYDLVVGHHTHLPQPLERLDDGRVVAWSLGNFLTAKRLPVLGEGALLKVGLRQRTGGPPVLSEVRWRAVLLERDDPAFCRVRLRPAP